MPNEMQGTECKILVERNGLVNVLTSLAGNLEDVAEDENVFSAEERTMFELFVIDLRNMVSDMESIYERYRQELNREIESVPFPE